MTKTLIDFKLSLAEVVGVRVTDILHYYTALNHLTYFTFMSVSNSVIMNHQLSWNTNT